MKFNGLSLRLRKMAFFLLVFLTPFVVSARTVSAQTPALSQAVTATIDASKVGPPLSPYVYGQFIEQAGSLIYDSLWCEMLDVRKFYYAVQPPPPGNPNRVQGGPGSGHRRGVGPGRWNPLGPADSVVIDAHGPFAGDHTPQVTLAGAGP